MAGLRLVAQPSSGNYADGVGMMQGLDIWDVMLIVGVVCVWSVVWASNPWRD